MFHILFRAILTLACTKMTQSLGPKHRYATKHILWKQSWLRSNTKLKIALHYHKTCTWQSSPSKTSLSNMPLHESTYPLIPSSAISLGAPSRRVLAQPGCVWIRTFTASIGAKAMSAKNSALADAARYREVRKRYEFSWDRRNKLKMTSALFLWNSFFFIDIFKYKAASWLDLLPLTRSKCFDTFLFAVNITNLAT